MDPALRRGLAAAAIERLQRPIIAPPADGWSRGPAPAPEPAPDSFLGMFGHPVVDDQVDVPHFAVMRTRRNGKQYMIEAYVAKVTNAELDALEAACHRARATGRGVRVVREPMQITSDSSTAVSASTTTTIEVTSEVPAGTIAYYGNGRTA